MTASIAHTRLAGLIIAPIAMSVFVAAARLYEREVRSGVRPTGSAAPPGISSTPDVS